MRIRLADARDLAALHVMDGHIAKDTLAQKLDHKEVLVLEENGSLVGWLRWSYFWDEHPFMNLLFLLEGSRGKGYGRMLVSAWEARMKADGHACVMTSTQANECAQFFYRHLGYADVGAFALPGDPLELMLSKTLE